MIDGLGDALLRTTARLTRWASQRARFDVPPAQARLLALVDELGPARVGDLAVADHTSQPSMSAQLARVEEHGWVTRAADPADSRAWLISLAPAGADALARVRAARAEVLAPVLDGLDDDERARLAEAVDVLEGLLARAASVPTHA
ncbi:MarR family winged helix-turn-helix transcriptional regulator [Angustibacter speluncae]